MKKTCTLIASEFLRFRPNRFILITLLSIQSCSQLAETGNVSEKQIFKEYLRTKFNRTIGADTAYYIMVSSSGCIGCITGALSHYMTQPNSLFIVGTRIYRKHQDFLQSATETGRILLDTTEDLERMPLHAGNIAIIICSGGEVDTIIRSIPQE